MIGNEAYQHATKLPQAPVDTQLVAAKLEALGFEVMHEQNLERTDLARAVVDFGTAMRGADVGFFYYAGHGVQVNGKNDERKGPAAQA